MFKKFKEKYIGDRAFYGYVLGIAMPMIIQNLITNFVSMLDNIMVGRMGTAEMSGVSIANQYLFIFNITIFGAVSGASIFGTQFFGKGDYEGQKYTLRFRLLLVLGVVAAFAALFLLWGRELIELFLDESDSLGIRGLTLSSGESYLKLMILGLPAFGFGQAYASVIRESGETKIPMYASILALGLNLVLDYGLIFGRLGMPRLGVEGAAIATIIAKLIEALFVIIWAHARPEKNPYIRGLFRGFYIPGRLMGQIVIKGCPLLINEFLWSLGVSLIAQSYSVCGIEAVAARNIANTINNMFNVFYVQLGGALGIIIGMKLGAGKLKEAVEMDRKLVFFNVFGATVIGLFMLPLIYFFPLLYNTESAIRELAGFFIFVQIVATPVWAYTNACYFTLRSGGKTGITFLFDFVFSWVVQIPLAFVLTHYTGMDIHLLYFIVTMSELLKVGMGYYLLRSNVWVNNIVEGEH